MEIITASTNRLKLRLVTQELLEYAHKHYSDQELMKFLGLGNLDDLKKERQKFARGLFTHNKSILYFQLFEKGGDTIIGVCGYHTWYTDHNRAELFYMFRNEIYKNQGYMSEALTYVLNFGFETMKLNRVEAFIGKDNHASLKLVKRFNFQEEGLLKNHYLVGDEYQDSLVFGLVN